MTTSIQTNIKPINDFAAAMAEIEHWKEKFEDLQSQITDLRRGECRNHHYQRWWHSKVYTHL
jgi:chromosome segregation ATPase